MFRLAIRTLPGFAVIIGFATLLAAYMNYSGVRTAYLDLIRSRMEMIAEGIGNDIATASSLGIGLAEQSTLPGLLALQASADPLTLSIDVDTETGGIVFSSDPARIGMADDAAADAGAFRYGRQIVNDFGAPVGAVTIRFDRTAMDAEIDRLRFDIIRGAVPAGLGAMVAGCLICFVMLTGLHRRARQTLEDRRDDDPIAHASLEMQRLHPDVPA